jgi:hypothetical protein
LRESIKRKKKGGREERKKREKREREKTEERFTTRNSSSPTTSGRIGTCERMHHCVFERGGRVLLNDYKKGGWLMA